VNYQPHLTMKLQLFSHRFVVVVSRTDDPSLFFSLLTFLNPFHFRRSRTQMIFFCAFRLDFWRIKDYDISSDTWESVLVVIINVEVKSQRLGHPLRKLFYCCVVCCVWPAAQCRIFDDAPRAARSLIGSLIFKTRGGGGGEVWSNSGSE
jgi:hypothetical protein